MLVVGRGPIPIDLARQNLLESITPLCGSETIPIESALGRIAAENFFSTIDLPSTYNAAVDGYCFKAKSLAADPSKRFKVIGVARAGHPFLSSVCENQALEIYTGAIMPEGSDCVAMHENCTRNGDEVHVGINLNRGVNVRSPGENIGRGELVIGNGHIVNAALIGQLAACGKAELLVRRKLKIAVVSTGDEVVPMNQKMVFGQINDANRPMLKAMLNSSNIEVIDGGIIPDKLDLLAEAYDSLLENADVVISSGGASDGVEDHTQAAMKKIGISCAFWRLAMKPGRPMAVGKRNEKLVFCLPGNPVAAFVCTRLLVKPLLIRLGGGEFPGILKLSIPAGFNHSKKAGRAEYLRVIVVGEGEEQHLKLYGRKGAGVISSLTGADGLVEIPIENTGVTKGMKLNFLAFHERGL